MTGLRERKKRATRDALSLAALRLAVERGGLDNVLVEDIADAAGVSPRTFNNYFGSKAEAIVSRMVDRIDRVGEVLLARPADEPLWDAITEAVLDQYRHVDSVPTPEWLAGIGQVLSSPALAGEFLKTSRGMQRSLSDAIAKRIGGDDLGMFPDILAGAVAAAHQVATDYWMRADPPVSMLELVEQALNQLASLQDLRTGAGRCSPAS